MEERLMKEEGKEATSGQSDLDRKETERTPAGPGRRKHTVFKTAFAVSAILLLSFYIGFSFYFTEHFYPGTFVNGEDYSYKTLPEAEKTLKDKEENYVLLLTGRHGEQDTITSEQIDLKLESGQFLTDIKNRQKGLLWPAGLFGDHRYELGQIAGFSRDKLRRRINALSFNQPGNILPPTDAHIGDYDPETASFPLVKADPGTKLDSSRTWETVTGALAVLDEQVDLEQSGCYLAPAVRNEDSSLLQTLDKMNRYVQARVIYDWNGEREVVDGERIKDWLAVENGQVTLDRELIREYVNEMSREHDTYGKKRSFTTTGGRVVELPSGGYGWKTDREAETEALAQSVEKGGRTEKEPEYSMRAAQKGKEDIGDSYVEIDLASQHLYLYIDGAMILESDFVSGNVSRGNTTPPGVFGLTYKTRNAVLRGENYETPVSYWMPFNGNIGMHDASWRGSFGGEIYLTGGSHGCVNLPPDKAAAIYEYMYTGFPIICYD